MSLVDCDPARHWNRCLRAFLENAEGAPSSVAQSTETAP